MADDAQLKLSFRLVPADDRAADPVVLDDIVRLIRQAAVTLPADAPRLTEPADGFRAPSNDDPAVCGLEAKIKHRIEQASAASREAVAHRAEVVRQPDGKQRLASESLAAAHRLVATVQGAMLRRVLVQLPAAADKVPDASVDELGEQ